MASSLTHTQVRSLHDASYRVEDTVTASVHIPMEVFVFATATPGVYNRIATVNDIMTYPDSLLQAQTDHADYYRLAAVVRDFDVLTQAEAFATEVTTRFKSLVVEYDSYVNQFVGTTTETISS
jgi:hypothetical protein